MKKDKNRKSSMTFGEKMIFFAGILFCLVLITTAMMGGLFARYTTTGSGSDSARVAKWGELTLTESGDFVDDKGNSVVAKIIPGVNLEKHASVSFTGSEMATYVFAEVILSDHWTTTDQIHFTACDGNVSWQIGDGWQILTKAEGTNTYVFYQTLAPNAELVNASLVKDGVITVSGKRRI